MADLGKQLDTTTPSPARMYDYWLSGKDNYAADRAAADAVETLVPDVRVLARENRAFLRRTVEYLASECGVRQLVDIGSGLPAAGNVHEVAQAVAPETRVVYVDNDPVVLRHGQAILANNDHTTFIEADLRAPETILTHPELLRLINPDEPLALLMLASLHFIPDDTGPYDLLTTYRGWMPVGGYLAISHADRTPQTEAAAKVYETATSPAVPRSHDEVRRFFGEFELADPGLVQLPAWRPSIDIAKRSEIPFWGGVARKVRPEKTDG